MFTCAVLRLQLQGGATGREDASNELQIEELPRPPEKAQAAGGREDESKEPQTPTGREDESKEPRTPVSRRPSGRAQAAV
ncbi:hypothetical protein TGVAND_436680, partial [Toxoplasma gondii VAND]